MTDQNSLAQTQDLVHEINYALMKLPGHRIVSLGTRISLEAATSGRYFDTGLDYVAEFQQLFGAHVAKVPGIPDYSGGYAGGCLAEYQQAAAFWGERLKTMAQKAREHGDEAGALVLIRLQLCQEELAELAEAILARDIVGVLDALTDMTYVADGAYLTFGLAHYKLAGLAEVHRSNMSKMGPDGRPVTSSAGRIVKGPNYSPPDLERVLYGSTSSVTNSREPGEFGDGVTVGLE